MSDGARTRDILDHNQVLYLLSYAHHVGPIAPSCLALVRHQGLEPRTR